MAATQGKVVVMSFIYTHCTDICPYIAVKEKDAYALLGNDAAMSCSSQSLPIRSATSRR